VWVAAYNCVILCVADEPERKQPEAAAPKKSADAPPKKKKKIELSLREEIELEMLDNRGETPTVYT